ncbi:NAD(P)-binding protein [Hortaea werneckii]|nr:NAD(P)-binding protein [Hortaea werneckii]KAI7278083.1 NAD(P)-binding protein [Hortaea werneckii]KAI7626153.1 NAD(P)-binding protein [Hortaea werneckii]KAI7634125.1 NAD(P)-binding protein [Hortaea werneckii]KAI7721102.1 NAD(P)-binding protein [Hortaea werneckii]
MRSSLPGQLSNTFHLRSACVHRGHFMFSAPTLWTTRYAGRSGPHSSAIRNISTASLAEKIPGLLRKREEVVLESSHSTEYVCRRKRQQIDLNGRVYVVTGGASGIGLSMAEGLAEAGGTVYCLDRSDVPNAGFRKAVEQLRADPGAGALEYKCVDVNNTGLLNEVIDGICSKAQRLDGLIAAAGINQVTPALECRVEEARKLMDIDFIGVLATATACARQMIKYKSRGSICLIASMSGLIANKGMVSPVYNSSKAAVIQLARNLAMEWGRVQDGGASGIRVNALSPGHVLTPMVLKTFEEVPAAKEKWEAENLMGRLGDPSEFKGAALFLLSEASSFMTGSNLIIDGGHTAW